MNSSDSTAEQDALAFRYYDETIRSAQAIKIEIDALVKAGARIGTSVLVKGAKGSKNPLADAKTMLVSRLFRAVEHEENVVTRLYNKYRATTVATDKNEALMRLCCPNVSFYAAVWREAKRCTDVLSFLGMGTSLRGICANRLDGSAPLKIDIVSQNGAEWVKVVNITRKKLLHEMTGAGWDWDYDGEDLNPAIPFCDDQDAATGIEPLDVARKLIAAAKELRACSFRYQSPSIRIVLPRIKKGEDRHADQLIRIIEAMGTMKIPVTIDYARDGYQGEEDESLQDAFSRMIPTHDSYLTPTLNLDCTVLFNLASDIAHSPPETFEGSSQYNHLCEDFIDEKVNGPRLLTDLYPALRGRHLVCTEEAAENFRSTALDIGTSTEIERLEMLLSSSTSTSSANPEPVSDEQRRDAIRRFRMLSSYPVPDDLFLPITVVKAPTEEEVGKLVEDGELPQIVADVVKEEGIKKMTRSTIWHTMVSQTTTLTSNKTSLLLLNAAFQGHGGIGQRRANFIPFEYGRRLAAKPRPQ